MDPAHLWAQRPVARQRQPNPQGEFGHAIEAALQEQRIDRPVPVALVMRPAVPAHTAAKLLQAQPKNAPLLFLIRRGGGQFYAVIER